MLYYINGILALIILSGVTFVYNVKHEAKRAERYIVLLEKKILEAKTRNRLLRAEWSVLTQPDRLQFLANRYKNKLTLEPALPAQFISTDLLLGRESSAEGLFFQVLKEERPPQNYARSERKIDVRKSSGVGLKDKGIRDKLF